MPPFDHLPSPFKKASQIKATDVHDAKHAIHMDFGNYTIGRLIPGRAPYNDKHPEYRRVRRQIEARIMELGYSAKHFHAIDSDISGDHWHRRMGGRAGVDRYGKKYSWISFFEMYGLREDHDKLDKWRAGERASDVDIDPSFPEAPRAWFPKLPDVFSSSPIEPQEWVANGPTPNYGHLLNPMEVEEQRGPWVLLDGHLEQSAPRDERHIFTLLRGVFVSTDLVQELLVAFNNCEYPGNDMIPDPATDHYIYAGEIPWSNRFGHELREPNEVRQDRREAFRTHDGTSWNAGLSVEIPVRRFGWERHHSELNQVSGVVVPAPALCHRLGLAGRLGEWDLYDAAGGVAAMYRESKGEDDVYASYLAYIRCDLLAKYLAETGQTLVWMLWGERDVRSTGDGLAEGLRDLFVEYRHIHRRGEYWPRPPRSS